MSTSTMRTGLFVSGRAIAISEQQRRAFMAEPPDAIEIEISTDVDRAPRCGEVFIWTVVHGATGLMKVVAVRRADEGDPLARIVRLCVEPMGEPPSEPAGDK